MFKKVQDLKKNKLFLILAGGFLLQLLLIPFVFNGDVANHFAWAEHILKNGPRTIYDFNFGPFSRANANYPPLILWIFTVSLFFTNIIRSLFEFFNTSISFFPSKIVSGFDALSYFVIIYKLLFLIPANLGIAWLTYLFISQKETSSSKKSQPNTLALSAAALISFNPALIYGSTMWGQVDVLPLFFVLASLYVLLYKKNVLLSSFLLVISLLLKQTVIIFFPLFFLALLKNFGWKSLLQSCALSAAVIWITFVPFISHWASIISPFITYLNKVQFASFKDVVTGSAWNMWFLVFGFKHISDTQNLFLGITYEKIGYALTFISLLTIGYFYWRTDDSKISSKQTSLFYAFLLIAFASVLFLTRLHERHFLQIIPFLILLYSTKKNQLIQIVFLNLFIFANLYYYWNPPHSAFNSGPLLTNIIRVGIIATLIIFCELMYRFFLYSKKLENT
ncbi:MAG: hypothetical protein ABIO02_01835 [Patescibacteria group bacterium]